MFLSSLLRRYNKYSKDLIHALIYKKIRSFSTEWTCHDAYPVYMQSNFRVKSENWQRILDKNALN